MSPGPSEGVSSKFVVQVAVSAILLLAGFGVLFFNLGDDPSLDKMASAWVGAVVGFWLQ